MRLTVRDLRQDCWGIEVEPREYPAWELKCVVCKELRYCEDDVELVHEGRVWDVYVLGGDDEVVVREADPWECLKKLGLVATEENLKKAINKEDLRMVRLLTAAGAAGPLQQRKSRKNPIWTPLHLACRLGNLPIVSTLLDFGIDVNEANAYGATPLHTTVKHSNSSNITQVIDLLIERGATLHSRDALRHTPLYYATQRGCLHIVNFLKQCGATV
eukprot:TRINITY_DN3457_c0_g3_i1.p1 TRINITY_DN3457_c0_g3~~TRINITY_DN3457_c0_g3_i1.p1  ORF type:complete len:216 (+),score=33.32 TRINITY_DN3457_c0_g3_i1:197-844(+)